MYAVSDGDGAHLAATYLPNGRVMDGVMSLDLSSIATCIVSCTYPIAVDFLTANQDNHSEGMLSFFKLKEGDNGASGLWEDSKLVDSE